ncbi:uncharacterized protein [Diadema setosum]|uniref:uncharacterized protein n=1 Tax=Diadema setosum TaxID=31175 RepID=UPI003B3A4688
MTAPWHHVIKSDSGQDVTLKCFLQTAGKVELQFWQYALSEDPLQECRNRSFDVLTSEWPAYGVIQFGAQVTPQLKSRLILTADFDLILLNASRGHSGCYQCGQITFDAQKFIGNVTILTVMKNNASGKDNMPPFVVCHRTALYISIGIVFWIASLVVVIAIRKRGKFFAIQRSRPVDRQSSAKCLPETKKGTFREQGRNR